MFPVSNFFDTFTKDDIYMDSKSFVGTCLLMGDIDQCRTELLFQAAVSYASIGKKVYYYCPFPLQTVPLGVHSMPEATESSLQLIQFHYPHSTSELYNHLTSIGSNSKKATPLTYPDVIIIDDYYDHYSDKTFTPQLDDSIYKFSSDFALIKAQYSQLVKKLKKEKLILINSCTCMESWIEEIASIYYDLCIPISIDDTTHNHRAIFKMPDDKKYKMSTSKKDRSTDPRLQALFPLPTGLRASVQYYGTANTQKHRTEEEYFDSGEVEEDMHKSSISTSKSQYSHPSTVHLQHRPIIPPPKKVSANDDDLPYQPGPGSPGYKQVESDDDDNGNANQNEDEEDDPLDQFMSSIESEAKRDLQSIGKKKDKKAIKGTREDIEQEDDQESYFRWLEENPNAGLPLEDDDDMDRELDYDDDGNLILPEKSKYIDPLPPIDHSEITYLPFVKNFYVEHEEIKKLTNDQVEALRLKHGVNVAGAAIPKPVASFAHFGFDERLMKIIRKSDFTSPTPIQAQAIPSILMGRDVIGIAKTGSGKTGAFVWPAIAHIMDQKQLEEGDGPIVLICAPTRELAQQIHLECKKFGKPYNINSVCAFGGGGLHEQTLACKEGCEILVCTPGRLIDLVRKKGTNLNRVTYMVLDEADRMFDMGFEPQVRSIADHVRPDRQCLLFSATFRKKIERLARDILNDPIRIVQGEVGEANQDVIQIVQVVQNGPSKWIWLTSKLVEFTISGKVLIFVTRKDNCAELAKNLKENGYNAGLIHGDMVQMDRNQVISDFKKRDMPILVATDVAARGLDIPSIRTVINYDVARDIDTHTHRIGRTGRAGEKGTAYTLLTPNDTDFAPDLVRNLEGVNQFVPQELIDLAMQNSRFNNTRFKQGTGKRIDNNRLQQRERPGFGSTTTVTSQTSSSSSSSSSSPFSYIGTRPNAGPMADWRGMGSQGSISGGRGDRAAAMKQAFQQQFKSSFVRNTIARRCLFFIIYFVFQVAASSHDTGFRKANSVAVPSSVTQKRTQNNKDSSDNSDPSSKTKKSRWSD
ncbi:unnamed protein product [Didymodactylos carnosus]|uniref:ATP-dependent RNA helicase DDX42 n=1 Tax=Didymodactylos carnosus TaxID=1234261 RepID=A0A815DGH0_9BILA|nr:unnamed protein product [Didymodactylos carnosus]CAF1297574.1 unnamed protein product [Didymodactylos carnosus]CAF3974047.1 unnamed protein product [Didymodactylos carnosus]CAF4114937.1 unnamed protein product [Didymodactylos carnosus]